MPAKARESNVIGQIFKGPRKALPAPESDISLTDIRGRRLALRFRILVRPSAPPRTRQALQAFLQNLPGVAGSNKSTRRESQGCGTEVFLGFRKEIMAWMASKAPSLSVLDNRLWIEPQLAEQAE